MFVFRNGAYVRRMSVRTWLCKLSELHVRIFGMVHVYRRQVHASSLPSHCQRRRPTRAAAALLLPLCLAYANQFPQAVRRAGHRGNRLTLGARLFKTILAQRSGVVFSVHRFDEV